MASSNSAATAQPSKVNGNADIPTGTSTRKTPKPKRPNYKHIHRFPLPLTVHPLPPLIPHNPLSVISIALSYLTYIISPPPQQEILSAYFDHSTSSVHVTDPRSIRTLWEMGFFGKGSLSRSEPTWLDREKKRRGLLGVDASEDVTRQRRVERREWKLERARKEKEAIAEQLKAESRRSNNGDEVTGEDGSTDGVTGNGAINPTTDQLVEVDDKEAVVPSVLSDPQETQKHENEEATGRGGDAATKTVRFSQVVDTSKGSLPLSPEDTTPDADVRDEEHLQLSNEEALFLVYGLGVLQIYDYQGKSPLSAPALLSLFRRHSYFPPRNPCTPLEPDDPFMLSYVAYHHFRSLGWIVRSGVKFGVDILLYNRGPVFSHAEFAVILLPSYSDPYWKQTEDRKKQVEKKLGHTWWWLHSVNRVQAQVKKSLILCYVEVPPPCASVDGDVQENCDQKDIGALLKRYKVRELSVKRWVPNRSRD